MQPLRSVSITEISSLLRTAPSPCLASVLSSSWGLHLNFSLCIETTGSHVPHKSLNQGHATFMPDAARPVHRLPPCLSRGQPRFPVSASPLLFRHLISGLLALISLVHTCHGTCRDFSSTLTTMDIDHSSLRWFEANSCKSAPRGLPSSLAQLHAITDEKKLPPVRIRGALRCHCT